MVNALDRPGLLIAWSVLIAFTAAAVWELRRPLFPATARLYRRWSVNFGLFVIGHASFHLFVPLLAALSAWSVHAVGQGLGLSAVIPWWLQLVVALVGLDFTRWAAHRALHHWPWLWRLHQVHHSDAEFDVTVGVRFHPLEALFYALLAAALVLGLGLAPQVVVAVELVFIAHNFFCHANAALPRRAEVLLRRVIITPDLHRVHHSADPLHGQTNFGTVLSVWDQVAGCHLPLPAAASGGLRFGLQGLPVDTTPGLWQLLCMPLRKLGTQPPPPAG